MSNPLLSGEGGADDEGAEGSFATGEVLQPDQASPSLLILWVDEIHRFESMQNQCPLVFAGESSFQGFLGSAGFRPPTVWIGGGPGTGGPCRGQM